MLAGGQSSRMGRPKASLDWHGQALLRRVTGVLARSVGGPVVVVGAPGQELPDLDPQVEVVTDAVAGRGPLQGLAAGLEAIGERAEVAYVSSTDVPLLHPAFVRRMVGALDDASDVALPEIDGFRQTLAAAYRVALVSAVGQLLDAGDLRPASLFARAYVRTLDRGELLRDEALAALDPLLTSVSNINDPGDLERVLATPAPAIRVREASGERIAHAWTLGDLRLPVGRAVSVNGEFASDDPELPLVAGDVLQSGTTTLSAKRTVGVH